MRDEDIFYSDDEFSDSEDFYQVGPMDQWSIYIVGTRFNSQYSAFPGFKDLKVKTYFKVPDYNNSKAGGSIFYQHGGSSLIEKHRSNTIDHPVNQISMGMAGMGLGGNFLNHDRFS